MPSRIRKLSITGFRGATRPFELLLDDEKPVTLIFGENGTGKSTIVDALECIGTGTTRFLDDWKLGKGKRKESFVPTLGKKPADIDIKMQVADKTYHAGLTAKGLALCDTPNRPLMRVLRRKSLQAFIEADQAQRYREVSRFLDIPHIETAEDNLRRAAKNAEDDFNAAVQASSQASEHLYGLWEAEGSPGSEVSTTTAQTWARDQAKADPTQLEQLKLKYGQRITAIESLLRASTNEQQAKANVTAATQQHQSAASAVEQMEEKSSVGSAALETLLQDAKTYLTAAPATDICPVCETTQIKPAELVARLGQRLTTMQQLSQANAKRVQTLRGLNGTTDQQQQATNALLAAASNVLDNSETIPANYQDYASLTTSDADAAATLARQLVTEKSGKLPEIKAQHEDLTRQLGQLNSIRLSVATLDQKSAEAVHKEKLSKRLNRALQIFEKQRKAHVESILAEIANAVDELYQQIHPDEAIGGLKLKLDQNQRGSLLYGVVFGDQADVQPQPYYSESHLDTLGLCIFLALAQRVSDDCIIVLDDVLGSVDQQHLNRTLDMLLDGSNNFGQVILTTHYGPLRDRFRFAQGASSKVSMLELKPWTIERGIRIGQTLNYRDELSAELHADDFNRGNVATQAGVLFENLLGFLSLQYRCKVPHLREPRYTFGDLNSAIKTKLRNALSISKPDPDDEEGARVETPLAPVFEELQQAIYVRNLVGCHFNQWAGELSDKDVRDTAKLALQLADTVICDDCGGLPTSKKSGNHWDCGGNCKKTQMQPMLHPG